MRRLGAMGGQAIAALALVVAACGGAADEPRAAAPVSPSPSPSPSPTAPPSPPSSPAPPQPVARVEDGALVLREGESEQRVALAPAAQVLLVELDARGERGVWIVSPGDESRLARIAPGPALDPLTPGPLVSRGWLGGGPSLSLGDLDGDDRYDVWSCTTRASDIGPSTSCYALRRGERGFEHADELARVLRRRRRGVALDEVLAAAGAGPHVVARASLGVVRLTPRRDRHREDAAASAGREEAILATETEPGGGSERFALRLAVIRAEPEPAVLATIEAGELHEAFTDDACRERFRLGAPMVRVAEGSPEGRVRALVVTRTDGARRVARLYIWDGAALVARGDWIEVDRCDTEARDVRVRLSEAGPVLDVAPLPEGVVAWF